MPSLPNPSWRWQRSQNDDSSGSRTSRVHTGLLQLSTGRSAAAHEVCTSAEHQCRMLRLASSPSCMYVTSSLLAYCNTLAVSPLARPVHTLLYYALSTSRDVPGISNKHCRARQCQPSTLRSPVSVVDVDVDELHCRSCTKFGERACSHAYPALA